MNTGAWFHLSVLEKAKGEYSVMLFQAREDALKLFAAKSPTYWSWREFKQVPMTLEVYWDKCFSPHYSRYYWAYPNAVESTIERLDELVSLAYRAEENLLFLTERDIKKFGDCLTRPVKPGEYPNHEIFLKS